MVFDWLKNALFGPKRREFLDLEDRVFQHEQRLRRIEGTAGAERQRSNAADRSEEMKALAAEAASLLASGKKPAEIIPELLAKHPAAAMRMAGQLGLKL